MAAKAQPKTAAVDGNVELEQSIRRYRQLDEWVKGATAEIDEIKDKFGVQIAERNVDALTLDGVIVARAVAYEKEGVDQKGFKAAHPRIFARFRKAIPVAYTKLT